jgi:hypothetical protein
MNTEIDWGNANKVREFGIAQCQKIGNDYTYSDIRIAINILRRFPKRDKFTFDDIFTHFESVPNITKERLSFILASIADQITVVTEPMEKPFFKLHDIYIDPAYINS